MNEKSTNFIVDKIVLEVGSGFYVRQFVQDIAIRLGTVGTALGIKRTVVGDYTLANIDK